MKIVIDTNVLVSGIFRDGHPRNVLDLWAKEQIEVAVSPPILEEYERLLEEMEHKKPIGLAKNWMTFIVRHSILIRPEGVSRL